MEPDNKKMNERPVQSPIRRLFQRPVQKPANKPVGKTVKPTEQKPVKKIIAKPTGKPIRAHSSKVEVLLTVLTVLVVLVIIFQFMNSKMLEKVGETIDCEDVPNARCVPANVGCHETETLEEWDCGRGLVCCVKAEEEEEEQVLPPNSELLNIPQNMCLSGDSGLKCEDSAADAYCKALGYSGYLFNSKICGCPSGTCENGNWANHPTQPLKYNCGSSGSGEWILSMACRKKTGFEETTMPTVRIYLGEDLAPLDGTAKTFTVAEEYDFKVYSPNINDGTYCTVYINDPSTGRAVYDRTGKRMRFENKNCVGEELLFSFIPAEQLVGDIELKVIIFEDGKEGSADPEDWVSSFEMTMTIVSKEDIMQGFVSLDSVEAGGHCKASSGFYDTIYYEEDNYILMRPTIDHADCYFKELTNIGSTCFGQTLQKYDNCRYYNLYTPFKLCAAVRFRDSSGYNKCYYADVTEEFEPEIDVFVNYDTTGDYFFFTCGDKGICEDYTFRYAFTETTLTCNENVNMPSTVALLEKTGGADDPYESGRIAISSAIGKKFCLKVSFKGEDWFTSMIYRPV